eukprot:gene2825-3265_t
MSKAGEEGNDICEHSSEHDFDKDLSPSNSYARSITLPAECTFRNLRNAKRFAIDIGGSLTKVAYLSEVSRIRPRHYSRSGSFYDGNLSSDVIQPESDSNKQHIYTVEEEKERGARLHFVKFETKYIESCIDFIQKNLLQYGSTVEDKVIKATGGGAYKYKSLLSNKLAMKVDKLDEMECLIKGCNFLLKNIPTESFTFQRGDEKNKPKYNFQNINSQDLYPYLLVNIGSGVSILKVDSEDKYERIGGTSTGGGTFWGLGSLLTDAKEFDELLNLANKGQHKNIDMLVKDIYGGDYTLLNLPGDLPASSFGKAARSFKDHFEKKNVSPCDVVKSLLHMICNDIGQISSLYAQLHGLKRLFFGGRTEGTFLEARRIFRAVGAFLKGVEENATSLSSGLVSWVNTMQEALVCLLLFDVLELDQLSNALVPCPLLSNLDQYKPDLEDLGTDEKARQYWLECFEKGLDVFVEQAAKSQCGQEDANERGQNFKLQFLNRMKILRDQPFKFGQLTVRSLLDTREQFLNAFGFCDPYLQIKQEENETALSLLPDRLKTLDSLSKDELQLEVITGLLAGNVFDWEHTKLSNISAKAILVFKMRKRNCKGDPGFMMTSMRGLKDAMVLRMN